MKVAQVKFSDYQTSVETALDAIGAAERLPQQGLIIIKPNLTNSSKPPVTTPVGIVEAIYRYCSSRTTAEVAVGEGCGSGKTDQIYRSLGYADLAQRYGIRLIDFNREQAVALRRADALQLKQFHMPEVVQDAYLISVPVLKDHSFTKTTIAMKNMFGIAPAPFYKGSWNKSKLHSPSTHRSVYDVCLYKRPDLSVVDATVALSGMHLSGTPTDFGIIMAGFDPVAVDAIGSRMLSHDPHSIEYLTLSDGVHGSIQCEQVLV